MNPPVLVSGASGRLGKRVVLDLAKAGIGAIALGRDRARLDALPRGTQAYLYEELSSFEKSNPRGLSGGILFHFAGVASRAHASGAAADSALRHAREMADFAAHSRLRGVVVVSSIYATLADQGSFTEYGVHKLAIEREFRLRRELATVTLRLPPVYGEGQSGSISTLAALIRRRIPLPLGTATQPRDYLAAANLTHLLTALVRAGRGAWGPLGGLIAEPSDGLPISSRDLARMIGNIVGVHAKLLPVPARTVTALATVFGKREMVEAAFTPLLTTPNALVGNIVGWQPRFRPPDSLTYLAA